MASKKSFIDINDAHLNHFNLELGDRMGLLVNDELCSIYVTDDITTWKNVTKNLVSSSYDIDNHSGKKRAYILPNCDVTVDRIKAACKEHGITITNDIDKADILLTHDNINRKYSNGDYVRSTDVSFKLWNYDTTNDCNGSGSLSLSITDSGYNTIVDWKLIDAIGNTFSYGDTLLEAWCLSGLGLKISYLIDTKQIETLSVEGVLNASATKVILDKSLLSTIKDLLNSYDRDNKAMAGKILPTIVVDKNIHLVWELMSECSWEINQVTDKDVKYWLSKSNISDYSSMCAEDMILHLSKDDAVMDKETFRYFEKLCREEIEISNRELYVFKVKLKKEYRHYYE
jgi:hypothetical protein